METYPNPSYANFVEKQLKDYPGSRRDVLDFIWDILVHTNNPDGQEAIVNLFNAGYCYYFALMLKDAFGGDIRWLRYKGHIVWVDVVNMIPYDINGVYPDADSVDLLPLDLLGDDLEGFRHRGRDDSYDMVKSANNAIDAVENYTKIMTESYKRADEPSGKEWHNLLIIAARDKINKLQEKDSYKTDYFT